MQVHLATLNGQKVVVKVQRPGLKQLFDIDLKNVRVLAQWLQNVDPKSDGAARDWVAIYDECSRILYQVNLTLCNSLHVSVSMSMLWQVRSSFYQALYTAVYWVQRSVKHGVVYYLVRGLIQLCCCYLLLVFCEVNHADNDALGSFRARLVCPKQSVLST